MYLELHDNEEGRTLVARVKNIEFMYQAEQWVIDTTKEEPTVIEWRLYTEHEVLIQTWRRQPDGEVIEAGVVIEP